MVISIDKLFKEFFWKDKQSNMGVTGRECEVKTGFYKGLY